MTENSNGRHHELTPKQQEFFRQNRTMIQQIDSAMKGALQLIVVENDIQGKITLTDDCSELIIEEQ